MSEMLKVSSTSDPSATAGALANTIREEGQAEMQAIGPKAVNQAIKSITIARGYMAPSGVDLIFDPAFVDVNIDGEKKTAIRMFVSTRLPYQTQQSKTHKEVDQSADKDDSEVVEGQDKLQTEQTTDSDDSESEQQEDQDSPQEDSSEDSTGILDV